jgi:hypothetical protein
MTYLLNDYVYDLNSDLQCPHVNRYQFSLSNLLLFTTFTCIHKGGILFKGNLRGVPAISFEKITTRLEVT